MTIARPEWTPEEDAILYAHYPSQLSCKMIALQYLPGRSSHGVKSRSDRLGLKKGKPGTVRMMPWLLWQALMEGPGTPTVLLKRTGLKAQSDLYNLLRELHKKAKVIFILRWHRTKCISGNRMWVPVYAIGRDELDAIKPKPAGRTRHSYDSRLAYSLKGNPFAGLILESQRDPQPQEDVCP